VVILPDEHHYVRYCKPTQIDEGEVLSLAFTLREQDTDGLSGDHFEHYNDYQSILEALAHRLNPSKNACFAKLNCGEVTNNAKNICKISFVKEDENQSHTLMVGFTMNNDIIPALLVTLIKETKYINSI
jgi:hypothetical protein